MTEHHGNTLKNAQENTKRSEAREMVRDGQKTQEDTMETKDKPLSLLYPSTFFAFPSQAHREARYARLTLRAHTKLRTTGTKPY